MILKILFGQNYPKWVKLLIDFFILSLAFYVINSLIELPSIYFSQISHFAYAFFSVTIMYFFKVYHSIFRYFNAFDSLILISGILTSSLILLLYSYYFDKPILINHLVLFFISASTLISFRLLIKIIFSKIKNENFEKKNIMIFSAGNTAVITKRAFYNNFEYKICGFIDDDKSKVGKTLDGVPIFRIGPKLDKFVLKKNISKVIISTEKISFKRQSLLFNYFENLNIQLLKLPPVKFWINGIPNIYNLKEIKIEELLNRGLIEIDNEKNKHEYYRKTILVTGAAGSICSEIIRQLLRFEPAKIILIDNSETPMFNFKEELKKEFNNTELIFCIESITDSKAMKNIFSLYKIDSVFHGAAYKHVGMMEVNPRAAIINNVYGLKLILDLSIKHNVDKFVLISSDKAVNPTNVMGASKRISELYLASKTSNQKNNTRLIITRFGNVLASNGSVVPLFEKQIERGGPITITHPEIVRYFMTITEASQLVLEAGTMGGGGEIFIFDMGEPVKIVDLAKKMIIQKGLRPEIDIDIKYIGLRPGEKLYEELLLNSEDLLPTYNNLIFIGKKEIVDKNISKILNDLIDVSFNSNDNFKIVGLMKKIVPEYVSNHSEFQILDNQ